MTAVLLAAVGACSFPAAAASLTLLQATRNSALMQPSGFDNSTLVIEVADATQGRSIASIAPSGPNALVTTRLPHRFSSGQYLYVKQCPDGVSCPGVVPDWDGWHLIVSTPSATTLTFASTASGLFNGSRGLVLFPIHDTDESLFPGAAHFSSSLSPILQIGRETVDAAPDGKLYSRALQCNTTHYYFAHDGKGNATSGSFQTTNVPLGDTYPDSPLTSSSAWAFGNRADPTVDYTDPEQWIIDPSTGIALKPVTYIERVNASQGYTYGNISGNLFTLSLDRNAAWGNPQNAIGVTTAATISAPNKPLFLAWNGLQNPALIGPADGIQDMRLNAYCSSPNGAQLAACLTADSGQSCATATATLPICPVSPAQLNGPAAYPLPNMSSWKPLRPLAAYELANQPAPTVSVSGSVVTWISGAIKFVPRKPGSKVQINGIGCPNNVCTIAHVDSDTQLTLQDFTSGSASAQMQDYGGGMMVWLNNSGTASVNFAFEYTLATQRYGGSNGSFLICHPKSFPVTTDRLGNPISPSLTGRLCNFAGAITLFIDETGESRLLSIGWGHESWLMGLVQTPLGQWSDSDPFSLFASNTAFPGHLLQMTYQPQGDFREYVPGANATPSPDKFHIVDLSGNQASLGSQLAQYTATSAGKWWNSGIFGTPGLSGVIGPYTIFTSQGGQDVPCLKVRTDPASGQIVQAFSSMDYWGGCHSAPTGQGTLMNVNFNAIQTFNRAVPLGGPFELKVTAIKHGNNFAGYSVPITAVSNAAVAQVTAPGSTLDFTLAGFNVGSLVTISGATGLWSPINGDWQTTRVDDDHFTIPLDTRSFGVLTGSLIVSATPPMLSGYVNTVDSSSPPVLTSKDYFGASQKHRLLDGDAIQFSNTPGYFYAKASGNDEYHFSVYLNAALTQPAPSGSINVGGTYWFAEDCPTDIPVSLSAGYPGDSGITGRRCVTFRVGGQPTSYFATPTEHTAFPCADAPNDTTRSCPQNIKLGDVIGDLGRGTYPGSEKLKVVKIVPTGGTGMDITLGRFSGNLWGGDDHLINTSENSHSPGTKWVMRPTYSTVWYDATDPTATAMPANPAYTGCHDDFGPSTGGRVAFVTACLDDQIGTLASIIAKNPTLTKVEDAGSFAGSTVRYDPNSRESYPSHEQAIASDADQNWKADWYTMNPPFGGNPGSGSGLIPGNSVVPVSGTKYVYKVAVATGKGLDVKRVPPYAWKGYTVFEDMSGPGVIIDDNSIGKMCIASFDGECRPDARTGDAYVSSDFVTSNTYCISNGYTTVPCLIEPDSQAGWAMQFSIAPLNDGTLFRRLTMGFLNPGAHWSFTTWVPHPNGQYGFFSTPIVNGMNTGYFGMKLPPWPNKDGLKRNDFTPLTVAAPTLSGAVYGRVLFGYRRYGRDDQFYCNSRREACTNEVPLSNSGAPYAWLSEKVNRIPCSGGGCNLTFPTIPGKVVNYQVQLLDASGGILLAGPLLKASGVGQSIPTGGPALAVTLSHSGPGNNGNFVQGQSGSYTIAVSNAGGMPTAGAVAVTDTLPAHVIAASVNGGADWTCTLSPLQCTSTKAVQPSASFSNIILAVNVDGTAPASVTNTANASGGGDTTAGGHTINDVASVDPVGTSTTVLGIATTHPGAFTLFQGGEWDVVVSNSPAGKTTSGVVTVVDTLPDGFSLVSYSSPGNAWTCTGFTAITCTSASPVAAGSSFPQISIQVNVPFSSPPSVINNVKAFGGGDAVHVDAGSAVTASDTATIGIQGPVLAIRSNHSGPGTGGNFMQGRQGTYTIGVSNTGGGPTTTSVKMVNTLPAHMTATSISGAPDWTCTLSPLQCTTAKALPPSGSYANITLAVNVDGTAPTSLTNTANVSGGGDTTPAGHTANDVTPVDSASSTPPVLAIANTHTGSFTPGQTGEWDITVSNTQTGSTTSGTVTVIDTLPLNYTLSSFSSTGNVWACSSVSATVTCTTSTAVAGGSSFAQLKLLANIPANSQSSVTNTAKSFGGGDTVHVDAGTAVSASDSVSVVGGQAPVLTLAINQSGPGTSGNFIQGRQGTYTIAVSNTGAGPTTGTATLTDTLPTHMSAASIAGGADWTCTTTPLQCTSTKAVAAGNSYASITLVVNVDGTAPASLTETANISGGGDTTAGGHTTNHVTAIDPAPVLAITKSHTGSFTSGQTGEWDIAVSNTQSGSVTSGSVTVIDTLPSNYTLSSYSSTSSVWSCTSVTVTVTCTASAAVAGGGSFAQLKLLANIPANSASSVTNNAMSFGGGDVVHLDSGTATTASDTVTVGSQAPVLAISGTHSGPGVGGNFIQGRQGTYTIAVSNTGAGPTTGTVTLTDTLPAHMTAASITGGADWSCTVSPLRCTSSKAVQPNNSYANVTLTVNVDGTALASLTNTANVSGGGDSTTGGHTTNDVTSIDPAPVLSIAKSHTGTFAAGQTGEWDITVNNTQTGSTTSGTVTVIDTLPVNYTLSSYSSTGNVWSCSSVTATVTCTASAAVAGGSSSALLKLIANIPANSASSITNTAKAYGGGDVVHIDAGTAANASDSVTLAVPPVLSMAVTHSGPGTGGNFIQGRQGTYTIVASNTGAGTTIGTATVTDTLPAHMTPASITGGTDWTCTLNPLQCTSTKVVQPSGSYTSITLMVNVDATAPASLTNTANVSGGGDTTAGGHTINHVTPVDTASSPVLAISKIHPGIFNLLQAGEWDITVSNVQPGTTTTGTVTVIDTLPNGYLLSSYSSAGSAWVCAGSSTITCTTSMLAAGGSSFPQLALFVNVPFGSPQTVVNTAKAYGGGDTTHADAGTAVTTTDTVTLGVAAGQTPTALAVVAATDNQSVPVNTLYAALKVKLTDSTGAGVAGKSITFTAPPTNPTGTFQGFSTAAATTDSSGIATASAFTAGATGGRFSLVATYASLSASFTLTNQAIPATITATSGANQSVAVGSASAPMAATVLDGSNAPVVGAIVTFSAPATGPSGTFPGNAPTAIATTNTSGIATAPTFTVNNTPGAYSVQATVASLAPATFALTNTGTSPPTADSVTGISPNSLNQTLTLKYSSANGFGYLSTVHVLFNATQNGVNACWVYYDKASAGIYLTNNSGNGSIGPLLPGGSLSNTQCTVNSGSISGSGNTLTMFLNVTFSAAFGAAQQIFMYAVDAGNNNSGWQNKGATGTSAAPTADSVTGIVNGQANQTLTLKFSSASGFGYLSQALLLINGSLSVANGCWVYWDKLNGFYLVNDTGSGLVGPVAVGSGLSISNSQCTLNGNGSSVTGASNTLTIVVNLSFNHSFAGTQQIFIYTADQSGASSGWQAKGTVVVP